MDEASKVLEKVLEKVRVEFPDIDFEVADDGCGVAGWYDEGVELMVWVDDLGPYRVDVSRHSHISFEGSIDVIDIPQTITAIRTLKSLIPKEW